MKAFHLLSVVLGGALLLVLILGIGPATLWKQLATLGWGLVPLILIEGLAEAFHTCGFRRCLSEALQSRPFHELFFIRMAGSSINYLTPTAGFGGEVTKGALLARDHHGAEAASGVIIDKLSYALSQIVFVLGGSVITLWLVELSAPVWLVLFLTTGLLTAGVLIFLVVQKYGKLGVLIRWLAVQRGVGRYINVAARHMTDVDSALSRFYRTRPADLPISVLWHLVGITCGIVQTFYFLVLLTDHPSLSVAAAITFFGMWFNLIGFAIPIDIGVLEATRIISFRLVGLYSALGLTYGIMLRIEQLFWAGIGLLFYAVLVLRPGEGRQEPSERRGGA